MVQRPGSGRIVFTLTSAVRIVRVGLLLGGDETWIDVDDGAQVGALRYTPTRVGEDWPLYVRAMDARGCEGSTGVRRRVRVR